MTVKDIFQKASESKLLADPYVKRIWELMREDLFSMSPESLARLRKELIGESLRYFQRTSPYYADLFERTGIDLKDPGHEELARLAVPSDMLRGEGQGRFLIPDVEPGGETFSSSGTTGGPRSGSTAALWTWPSW
jgi:phenylacetate-CoA ligase